mgnify:FL=1
MTLRLALLAAGMLTTSVAFAQQPTSEAEVKKAWAEFIKKTYDESQQAETFEQYDQIVKSCDEALPKITDQAQREYLRQLSAWAYNRRGKEYSKQAGEAADAEAAIALEAKAMADFQESVRRDGNKWQAIHNRGVSYALLGEYEKALADFDRTVEINPKFANAWFNRGEIRFEQQEFEAAAGDYSQAITLKPADAGAYSARGHAYYRLKRYQGAVADFSKAVQLEPADAVARTDRGDVYANLGYWREAAEDYREAVKLDPDLGRAYMGAAWIMATCPDQTYRNADLAVQSAEKALNLDGTDDWRYFDTLAAAYANAGQFEAALEASRKAQADAPEEQTASLAARHKLYEASSPYRDTARVVDGN